MFEIRYLCRHTDRDLYKRSGTVSLLEILASRDLAFSIFDLNTKGQTLVPTSSDTAVLIKVAGSS